VPYGHKTSSSVVYIPPERVVLESGTVVEPTPISVKVYPEDTTVLYVRSSDEMVIDRDKYTLTLPIVFNRSLTTADNTKDLFRLVAGENTYSGDATYTDSTMVLTFSPEDISTIGEIVCVLEMATYYRGPLEWVGHPHHVQWINPLVVRVISLEENGFSYIGKHRTSNSMSIARHTALTWEEMSKQQTSMYFSVSVESLLSDTPSYTPETDEMEFDMFDLDNMNGIDHILVFSKS
jgi:hypothetical protein